MRLILYGNLNKLRFNLLHNSRLSATYDHYFIEKSGFGLPKEKKKKTKSKCSEVWLWNDSDKNLI
jgi:hypothetical protein